ncbi:bifunctional tetrahydrofolate synthase/dihydrofolate synthase [Caldimonas tepidiphila]|uniref:bifunctional tetrahydrofolate synthase/dihydrofolate synthase n=1 Tax=Caldimonas tepidiphila TaxID=2315841 RepID=UPI000E5BE48A|nr:bifunctional tetrahydrofolate synthase/dihydrofolate synthase [Caldimonas tepidiphila]
MPDSPNSLSAWLKHCESSHPKEIDLTLDRVRDVKERLRIAFHAPVIVVAGTNGKGSTCAMLESIALKAGLRVGLYSKPHLRRFEERCRVNGAMVDGESLVPCFEAVERAREGTSLTYFEFTTLAIAKYLSQAPLDLVILEVGLGGRLDAVNAIDADCTIITSIDIDHTEYLGPTRESIGREKAGVMRPGRVAVVSDPRPPESVVDHAQHIGAHLRLPGRHFSWIADGPRWSWQGKDSTFSGLPCPRLKGRGQLQNAAGVLAALEALKEILPITEDAVAAGLADVTLPGRFQVLPGAPAIVLDVAHNPQSVKELAHNLREMGSFTSTQAVFGCMHDKDIRALLESISPLIDHWHFTDLPVARAATSRQLASMLMEALPQESKPSVFSCWENPRQAVEAAVQAARPDSRIVVFGSFHTVGGALDSESITRRSGSTHDR